MLHDFIVWIIYFLLATPEFLTSILTTMAKTPADFSVIGSVRKNNLPLIDFLTSLWQNSLRPVLT
jgi:hypothetical protein